MKMATSIPMRLLLGLPDGLATWGYMTTAVQEQGKTVTYLKED